MHPYLVELAAAERRQEMIGAADRHRRASEARDASIGAQHNGPRRRRRLPTRRLLDYVPFGFLARLGATRGGSPGIFG